MAEAQLKLNSWNVVQELTEHKTNMRSYWKAKYGMSLTAYITIQITKGLDFKECCTLICMENPSIEHKKIVGNIAGRYCEQKTALNRRYGV